MKTTSRNLNFFRQPNQDEVLAMHEIRAVNLRKTKRAELINKTRGLNQNHQSLIDFQNNWITEELSKHNEFLISNISPANKVCILIEIALNTSITLSVPATLAIEKYLTENSRCHTHSALFNENTLFGFKNNLKSQNEQLQLATLKVFNSLTQLDIRFLPGLGSLNLFPILIEFLESCNKEIFTETLGVIYNFLVDHPPSNNECSILLRKFSYVYKDEHFTEENLRWIGYLLKNMPYKQLSDDLRDEAFKFVSKLIYSKNDDTLLQALDTLHKLVGCDGFKADLSVFAVKLLKHADHIKKPIQVSVYQLMQNLIRSEKGYAQNLISLGIIDKIISILNKKDNNKLEKEACSCLSRIFEGTEDQIVSVLSNKKLQFEKILNHPNKAVVLEGISCLMNILKSKSKLLIVKIVHNGILYELLKIVKNIQHDLHLKLVFDSLKKYCKFLKKNLSADEWDEIRCKFFQDEYAQILNEIQNMQISFNYFQSYHEFLDIIESNEILEVSLKEPILFNFS
ncbi:hypothetical protein SteCoe_29912 [Stentor coeruleus]|uniref:Armadillo repeat-containing domain-containing protein n=1 Tax=Stentor coeruleus TaxID=5963 RepID=A0A1R2B4S9_9CILI|nr:hypothetical protein SteCoe_29912 [Stentor coeruleus]